MQLDQNNNAVDMTSFIVTVTSRFSDSDSPGIKLLMNTDRSHYIRKLNTILLQPDGSN